MRCDKNSLTPGVSLGTMFPILHDGTTADDDSVTDASGGKAAGDAIGERPSSTRPDPLQIVLLRACLCGRGA